MPEGQSSYICQKFYDSSDIYNADKQEIIRNLWNTLFLCFPVVTTTLDSLCKRCFHLIPEYIDLELIDEAGQILPHNVVTALYRAKKAVIVGDIKQIEPIYNNVNKNFNEYQNAIGEKFENIKIEENSIQALASKNTDILSDGENIILNEHYRCERNIINFSNQNVYENKLNMNVEDKFDKPFFNNMIALDVRGKRTRKDNQNGSKNENKVEAEACIQAIKYIKEQDKSNPSIAIVTPFREQKRLLESRLEREGLTDIKIGTVHAFQGKEKDYVLFTPTLDAIEPKWAIKFIGDKYNMLNVAVTRAKKQFIYVGNVDVAERSENYIAKLIKYIKANGLVYSLYDIENSVLNKNFSERILQVLQPELEIANDNIGLYIQNNFKCGTIIDAKQHYDLLMYILKNTKKELLIMSPWLRKNVINEEFMNEIKRDIDATVLECARYVEFNAVMHNKGYSFGEINDEPVIYHPYCEEPIYIKSLGNQYHREQIKERLTTKVIPFQNMEQNKYYYQCKDYYRQYRQKKLPQLAGMYVARLVYLNILPQVKQKLSKETRRELKKLDQYTNDIELLAKNKIEDITQLDSYQENKQDELDYLIKQRQQCYYYRRNSKDEDEKEMWSTKAKEFTPQIKSLRFEIKSCKRIRERSIQKDIEKLAMKKIKQRESRNER